MSAPYHSSIAGFYKRGCQEKTFLPAREQRYCSGIQPLLVMLAGCPTQARLVWDFYLAHEKTSPALPPVERDTHVRLCLPPAPARTLASPRLLPPPLGASIRAWRRCDCSPCPPSAHPCRPLLATG